MAFTSHTILTTLLLLAILLPIHASEYRAQKPEPKKDYTPDDEVYGDDTYLPTPLHKPGKSLKKLYKDYLYPDNSYNSYSSYPDNSEKYLFLKGQNDARAEVGLQPFVWDDTLASYAQWWASQRVYDCALEHSNGEYGENIFWGSSGEDWSPAKAVDSWVEEKAYYDYNTNSCVGGYDCGHYTQIIWKDSTKIGCAKVKCYGDTGYFMTCNYDPPGNYIGTQPY